MFDFTADNSGNWFSKNNNTPSVICVSEETVDALCDVVRLLDTCQDDSILFRGQNCDKESLSLLSQNGTKCVLEPFADDCGNLIFKANASNAW